MRTTVTLDDDVVAEIERLRREEGIGPSEAVNRLIRAGLVARPHRRTYEHRSAPIGLRVDVTDIGAVLDLLDER
jgi:metal-responsive CopG/Arc/MetJ family transcriptional regulator